MSTLATISKTVTMPGCNLLRCGMEIAPGLSDDDLKSIGVTLNFIGECSLWWWGDYLCHIAKEKGVDYERAAIESSYSQSALASAKWLCLNLPLCSREQTLTYTHHREALSECGGNVEETRDWLAKAALAKWTVSELRKQIRISKGTHQAEEHEKAQPTCYDHWKEYVRELRKELETATPDYLDAVEQQLTEALNMVREARTL